MKEKYVIVKNISHAIVDTYQYLKDGLFWGHKRASWKSSSPKNQAVATQYCKKAEKQILLCGTYKPKWWPTNTFRLKTTFTISNDSNIWILLCLKSRVRKTRPKRDSILGPEFSHGDRLLTYHKAKNFKLYVFLAIWVLRRCVPKLSYWRDSGFCIL